MRLDVGIAAALCAAGIACTRPAEGRERTDFERMRQQQRYDAYGASAFFANGAVMQPAPAHTVPRPAADPWSGRVEPIAFVTGTDGSTDVADPPIPLDSATRARGAEQFAISCAPCHGAGGYGGGVMAPNLQGKRPPSLRAPPASTLPAGTIFKVITNGFGRMPAHGWQMPLETRWAVVAYVRSLTSLPSNVDTRRDSARAAYIHAVDSAHTRQERLAIPAPDSGVRRQ
jgi:mono/diheme cytochrome c family protein